MVKTNKKIRRLIRICTKKHFQRFVIILNLVFGITMIYFSCCQTQINEQLKNITKTQVDFIITERTAPPIAIIKGRFTNLFNYFVVVDPSTWEPKKIAQGEQTCSFSPTPLTKEYLELRKKIEQHFNNKELEVVLSLGDAFIEGSNKIEQSRFEQKKQGLLEKFTNKIKDQQKYHIRSEDGHITLAVLAKIHNPSDLPLTITTIDHYSGYPKSKNKYCFLAPKINPKPDIFTLNNGKLEALSLPYEISAKGGVDLVVAFYTLDDVLEINWGDMIETKLNALLRNFYYLGLKINEHPAGNDNSAIFGEGTLFSKRLSALIL